VHARRVRADPGPTDRRRLFAAFLSAILPGLGQFANGRVHLARRFAIPSLIVLILGWLLLQLFSPARIAATIVNPAVLGPLLVLNGVILLWRVSSVGQAFFDQRFVVGPGRLGGVGLSVILVAVAVPHVIGLQVGLAARDSFARIFEPQASGTPRPAGVAGATATPEPGLQQRLNVLVVGVDTAPWRTTTLTDTMMVVSIDPIGKTMSMLSVPRDMVNVPLGNGDTYAPKINSLLMYADEHPDEFPEGGIRALERAIGALLGIRIHYYATVDFEGFMTIIDTVGGIEVTVEQGFSDPTYELWDDQYGWSISAGTHHLTGREALAYVRSRKAAGESDFTRAARQQDVLLALRDKVTSTGTLFFQLPSLFDALGDTVRTDFPVGRLPDAAALLDEIENDNVTRAVIRFPLVGGARTEYGSVQIPDIPAIRAMAAGLFPEPGQPPTPWPTPKPTKAPVPSASPAL
jgi:LCP family protein required for cell wall assembly